MYIFVTFGQKCILICMLLSRENLLLFCFWLASDPRIFAVRCKHILFPFLKAQFNCNNIGTVHCSQVYIECYTNIMVLPKGMERT